MKSANAKTIGILFFISILSGFSAPRCWAAVYHSDGSAANVQALHNKALNGDTIMLPPGIFTWSRPVKIFKAIRLQGAGSGRIIGDTKSSVAVGTGSKTFTTTKGGLPISIGQTLRIAKMPHTAGARGAESTPPARGTYMEGAVTSYSDTTLMMNITSVSGSGTGRFWLISTKPTTTIVNDYHNKGNPGVALITVNQGSAGSVELTGLNFLANPATNNRSAFVSLGSNTWISPKTKIHDCWFQTTGGGLAAIFAMTNQGLVWNCSFDDTFSQDAAAFQFKMENQAASPSWSTPSTMGAADTNGATNFYVEDCDFHAFMNAADFDGNSRVVFRNNILDN
jgi:hypothetical protein